MKHEILRFEYLTKVINGNSILNNFSFNLYKGERMGLMCLNDAGKMALVQYLRGETSINSGNVYFDEHKINNPIRLNPVQLEIQYITSKPNNLIMQQPVANSLAMTHVKKSKKIVFTQKEIVKYASQLFEELDLDIPVKKDVSELSSSEHVFIELAKAYQANPKLAIIDIALGEVTKKAYHQFIKIINKFKEKGTSILIISHNAAEIIKVSDRITIFRNGENIKTFYNGEYNTNLITQMLLGENFKETSYSHIPDYSNQFIIKDLTSSSGKLNNIHCYKCEIVGIVDSNDWIANLLTSSFLHETTSLVIRGEIREKSFYFNSIRQAVKYGIGFIFEHDSYSELYEHMNISHNISVMAMNRIYKKQINLFNKKHTRILFHDNSIDISLHKHLTLKQIPYLSFYDRQQILLNRWLVFMPKVLICVKPFSYLDPISKNMTYSYFDKLARAGASIILISNDLSAVSPICDRVLILNKNEIKAELSHEDILLLISKNTNLQE